MAEEYLLPHVASDVVKAINKALTSVQSVNGKTPDKNGNVEIEVPEGDNSAQPDWNANEGEPGHILNKPEGVGYIEMEVLYDGELSYSDTVYHAPGFLAEDGETYTITWNGTPYTCTAKTIVADGVLAIVLGNVGVFVPEEEQTGEPFVYSWDETYGPLWFSFDENGNEINDANRLPTAKIEHHKTVKIPPQYLPEVVTDEQIASAVEDYMSEHPNSSQNPTGTKVYVTLADDGTIVIAPDVGDGLTNGVTITASLADDGTIVIGGE